MCFDTDSEPPIPRIAGAAVSHDELTLTADGNTFAAFLATPDEPSTTGIVILPDVRGLYHFYEELALRFAERGHAALAIDYFGRTAGVGKRDDEFEYMPHVEQTTDDRRAGGHSGRDRGAAPARFGRRSSPLGSASADAPRGSPLLRGTACPVGRLLWRADARGR